MPPSNIQDIYRQQGWNNPAAINADIAAGGWKSKVPQTSSGGGVSTPTNITNAIDPQQALAQSLAAGTAIRQFNIESAQPQIATLTQNKADLGTQYQNLLTSIKGDQSLAVNNATKATNATMAARGLSTQDPNAQTNLAGAQSQASQPYSSLLAQTGVGQAQDQAAIAAQIAALQGGNPAGAMTSGLQIGGLGQQAAGLSLQSQAQQFAQKYLNIPGVGVYDTTSGQVISPYGNSSGAPSKYTVLNTY